MTQQIQPLGTNPYAEEALQLANIGRGQAGMNSQVPVGPNLIDSGGMSKPNVNTQAYNNDRLMSQNMGQNMSTAMVGQQANQLGQVRKQSAEMSGAEYKAQEGLNTTVAQIMYANDGGNATFELGIPEVADRTRTHVAQQKVMDHQMNGNRSLASNRFMA